MTTNNPTPQPAGEGGAPEPPDRIYIRPRYANTLVQQVMDGGIFHYEGSPECVEYVRFDIARATQPATAPSGAHPEDYCHQCGAPNISWFAPSPLWNKAVREQDKPEILCPVCFVKLCESAGFKETTWAIIPRSYETPEAVQAAQEVVDIAYRDRGQVPHRDTIAAIMSRYCAATPTDVAERARRAANKFAYSSPMMNEAERDRLADIIAAEFGGETK